MPAECTITQIERRQNLHTWLVQGSVDALIFPDIPTAFMRG